MSRLTSRRQLLSLGPVVLGSPGTLLGLSGALLTGPVLAQPPGRRSKTLVVLFQRGAVDGLSMVVPYEDPHYQSARPNIALERPGSPSGALRLAEGFGLHPGLSGLLPAFRAKELAFVHAVGSPRSTRSHFEAQDHMESGSSVTTVQEGWLNRCLAEVGGNDPLEGVALGGNAPLSLSGKAQHLVLSNFGELRERGVERARFEAGLRGLYQRSVGSVPLRLAGEGALSALQRLRRALNDNGRSRVQYPQSSLASGLQGIAQLIHTDVGLRVAFLSVGGWDTHQNQGAAQGQLGKKLSKLGAAVAAFREDLAERLADVVLVSMTEFGRTVRQNGTGGTDHGHGSVMMALGGAVRGGKVYGQWPGLAPDALYERRDLAITTDYRDVLSEIVASHLGVRDTRRVFPGFTRRRTLNLI